LPATHLGDGGIAQVGQGAAVTTVHLNSSHGFSAARIRDSVPFATAMPHTPDKPQPV